MTEQVKALIQRFWKSEIESDEFEQQLRFKIGGTELSKIEGRDDYERAH